MDKQRIEGGLKKATGTIKEKAGQVTGDRDLEAEGTVEKGEGRIRSGIGKAEGRGQRDHRQGLTLCRSRLYRVPATTDRIRHARRSSLARRDPDPGHHPAVRVSRDLTRN